MSLSRLDFDRNCVGMESMGPVQLANRNLAGISTGSDLLLVPTVGMCTYSLDMLGNL